MDSHIGCADCIRMKKIVRENPFLRFVSVYNGGTPCQTKLKPKHTVQAAVAMHKEEEVSKPPVYVVPGEFKGLQLLGVDGVHMYYGKKNDIVFKGGII